MSKLNARQSAASSKNFVVLTQYSSVTFTQTQARLCHSLRQPMICKNVRSCTILTPVNTAVMQWCLCTCFSNKLQNIAFCVIAYILGHCLSYCLFIILYYWLCLCCLTRLL